MSPGFGLEYLETCEQVFAGSNAVAWLTRHATPFHYCQFIDLYFKQWDADKYEGLGVSHISVCNTSLMNFLAQFLLNNYKQALEIMQDMPMIKTLTCGHHLTDAEFSGWL